MTHYEIASSTGKNANDTPDGKKQIEKMATLGIPREQIEILPNEIYPNCPCIDCNNEYGIKMETTYRNEEDPEGNEIVKEKLDSILQLANKIKENDHI
jgi:hypothetical protein